MPIPRNLILLALTLLAGCSTTSARRNAIQSVFDQRAQIIHAGRNVQLPTTYRPNPSIPKATLIPAAERNRQASQAISRSVSDMKAIKVDRCPKDFQSAWFDYVVEVEDVNSQKLRYAAERAKKSNDPEAFMKLLGVVGAFYTGGASLGLSTAVPLVATSGKHEQPTTPPELIAAQERLDTAWRKLERCAMNYGVTPQRQ